MLSDCCPVCLSVTLVYCGQTVGRINVKFGIQVSLGPATLFEMGTQLPPKWAHPQFSAHVRCGQTAGWIKMPLGSDDFVLDGDPLPPKKGGEAPISADVRCGQTAGSIKMPLGVEVGLGSGDFVLNGNPPPPPSKRRWHSPRSNFRPMSIVARRLDGSRIQDATW